MDEFTDVYAQRAVAVAMLVERMEDTVDQRGLAFLEAMASRLVTSIPVPKLNNGTMLPFTALCGGKSEDS